MQWFIQVIGTRVEGWQNCGLPYNHRLELEHISASTQHKKVVDATVVGAQEEDADKDLNFAGL